MNRTLAIFALVMLTAIAVQAKPKRDPNRPAATPASVTLQRMSCFDRSRVPLWSITERNLIFHTPEEEWDSPPDNEQQLMRKFMADMLNAKLEVSYAELDRLNARLDESVVVPTDDPHTVLTTLGWYDVQGSNTTTTAISTTTTTTAGGQ